MGLTGAYHAKNGWALPRNHVKAKGPRGWPQHQVKKAQAFALSKKTKVPIAEAGSNPPASLTLPNSANLLSGDLWRLGGRVKSGGRKVWFETENWR